jgi:hypothetical protein
VLLFVLTGLALAVVFYSMSEVTGDVRVRLAPFCAALAVLWGEHA